VYAADIQKVILFPKMTITGKQHFFISRLVTFNQTFACLNDVKEPDRVAYYWMSQKAAFAIMT